MAYLTAAVILVGALSLLNLVLTLGVVRRLRDHSELLGRPSAHGAPDPILGAGEVVGWFEATTTDGDEVAPDRLADRTLVAFLSPDCFACEEQLPDFLDYAGGQPGGRRQVLAVVVGDAGTTDLAGALTGVARVVVEHPGGPLARAFGVQGFPVFCRLESDGAVAASGFDLRALRASERG